MKRRALVKFLPWAQCKVKKANVKPPLSWLTGMYTRSAFWQLLADFQNGLSGYHL